MSAASSTLERDPELIDAKGSPHIWRNGSYFDDQDGKYVSYWKTHQVIKVTNKRLSDRI